MTAPADLTPAEQRLWDAAIAGETCDLRAPSAAQLATSTPASPQPARTDLERTVRAAVLRHLLVDAQLSVTLAGAVIVNALDLSATQLRTVNFYECEFPQQLRCDRATFTGSVRFTDSTLAESNFADARFHRVVAFSGTTLNRNDFSGAAFDHDAYFSQTTFQSDAEFHSAHFAEGAWFAETQFDRGGFFGNCTFAANAVFAGANFTRIAHFDALFAGHSNFTDAKFNKDAIFGRSTFLLEPDYTGATFFADAHFDRCRFPAGCLFAETTFNTLNLSFATAQTLRIIRCTIEKSLRTDSMICHTIDLSRSAISSTGISVQLAARHVTAQYTSFVGSNIIVLTCEGVDFTGTDFGDHCLVEQGDPRQTMAADTDPLTQRDPNPPTTSSEVSQDDRAGKLVALEQERMAKQMERFEATLQWARHTLADSHTHIQSLQQSDVSNLSVARVSLAKCRLTSAHGLDRLRVDNTTAFETSRDHLARDAKSHVPAILWTRRTVIFEEGAVRRPRREHDPDEQVDEHLVATAYRELRKSLEDAKDEPGAADFYYGEMEMRRRGSRRLSVERWLLTAYWLISGYGLRAWRTIVALVMMFGLAAWVLTGTDRATTAARPPRATALREQLDYWDALTFVIRDATVLLRPAGTATVTTTGLGTAIDLIVRIATPVLFALAALAVRARVKR
ncbi:pentapeptide repeat-containing protein [Nocardia sp. 348MFTsu5.1]|uniref:pentapeptide repeat-containing protein n=1 Tax=Nocardia sp. 348MFTsu5.1 TaxID=1172185 RepID=UPI000373214F|nr:pentapeptide repeat-containing protein [Nocardia sp. 348MFTsu5.1]